MSRPMRNKAQLRSCQDTADPNGSGNASIASKIERTMNSKDTTNNQLSEEAQMECSEAECSEMSCQAQSCMCEALRTAGLRPTRQRVALGELLFHAGDRHVCAEMLHEEAVAQNIPVSLATVYNTLNQFRDAGLLREIALVGTRVYFDTNMQDHQHFFVEGTGELTDIPSGPLALNSLPTPPEGMEIAGVDIVVRLKKSR